MKSGNQEECVLCCREIEIYAIGICDHPVCYECSARMRVLCETNECPICRSDIPLVVFTHGNHEFSQIYRRFTLLNRKYQILFEDNDVRREFNMLLINQCHICEEEEFPTFEKLRDHVRRKHELFYCDLCNDSLKIFTFERKCYNRKDLARHKIKGDPDQTSHRGHPLCEFCDMRYVDIDDLFRHVRREHYFCHFCDADGLHQYYGNYDYLKAHFRRDHYLCEEGDCAHERFTAAFRTEIDLKAHKATEHSKNKSKAEVKQARTLDLEFNYRPPTRPSSSSSPRGKIIVPQRRNNAEEPNGNDKPIVKNAPEPVNTQSTQEFPYLSEDSSSASNSVTKPHVETSLHTFGRTSAPPYARRGNISAEDFPALGSATATSDLPVNQTRKLDSNMTAQPSRKYVSNLLNVSEDLKQEKKPPIKDTSAKPKWISQKDNKASFEGAFPKLETKKAPSKVTAPIENAKPSSLRNFTPPVAISTKSSANSVVDEEQFVIIKTKSKKKKHRAPVVEDDDEEEEDENSKKNNVSDTILAMNSFSILNNQENTDPIQRSSVMGRPRNYREPDPWETKVSFGRDDFPPLDVPKKPPPGLQIKKMHAAPPPGFTSNTNKSSATPLSMSSIARIVEKSVKNNHNTKMVANENNRTLGSYQEPPDFQMRNERLLSLIKVVSQTPENFEKFKVVSRNFRCNSIPASEYQCKCLNILGEEGYQRIFPELVSLLPDIPKQQELLTVHNMYLDNFYSKAKRKTLKSKNNVLSCKSCSQVLTLDDCGGHSCIL